MPKSTNKLTKISLIAKELAIGMERDYILAKFGKKWQAGDRTLDRYINEAQQEALSIQRATFKAVTEDSVKEAKGLFTGRILTKLEKQDKLRQIMNGELEVEKLIVLKGEIKRVKAKPDQMDIMKAIDLDNKMSGDYAPEKKEINLESNIAIFQIPDNDRKNKDN